MRKGLKRLVVIALATLMLGAMALPVSAEAEKNLFPADVFSSSTKAGEYFKKVSSEASFYTTETGTGDYVMAIPLVTGGSQWVYTDQLPESGNYTVEFELCPAAKSDGSGDMGPSGILLGTNAGGGFPWYNIQLRYKADGVYPYVWHHSGSVSTAKEGTTALFAGTNNNKTAQWYKIRLDVTATKTTVSVNGNVFPDNLITDKGFDIPNGTQLKYIGFYNSGGGFYQIKNFVVKHALTHVAAVTATEGQDGNIEYWYCETCEKFYSDAAGTTEIQEADTVTTYEPEENKPTGDNSVILVATMFVLSCGALVVLNKKRVFNR